MSNIKEIAQQLVDVNEYISIIYAFNATGKTRLSVAYKDITKTEKGDHTGVYYNAFSEDLFVWDNDEEGNNENIKLDIKRSSLNKFYSLLSEDEIKEELLQYNPYYDFKFILHSDPEIGIESVSFFLNEDENTSIKISRGEERIFIWCFFLALFKVEGWIDIQDAHFFIDDPVSSLDDNNIFLTADTIFRLAEKNFDNKKKIIVTTHHIGLFSILYDRFNYGEKAQRFEPNTASFMLKKQEGKLELKEFKREVFLFHLHLFQVLDEARKTQLYTFHFVLLRQLLENVVSFLGSRQIKFVLQEIKVDNPEETINMLNSLSHKRVFYPQISEMNDTEQKSFEEVFSKLIDRYKFKF